MKILADRRDRLLEKRRRRAEREGTAVGMDKTEEGAVLASTS